MTKDALCSAIILGAGSPYKGITPSALRAVGERGSVMDWQVHALNTCCSDIQFVGGYNVSDVADRYPDLTYILNSDWEKTRSLGSLRRARMRKNSSYFITYSDIVFWGSDAEDIVRVASDKIIFAIDPLKEPHGEGAREDLETVALKSFDCVNGNSENYSDGKYGFVGLVYVPQSRLDDFTSALEALGTEDDAQHVGVFIEYLLEAGVPIAAYDISGKWSDLNNSEYLTRFLMGSKAETLSRMEKLVKKSIIPSQVCFQCADYKSAPDDIKQKIVTAFSPGLVAVRSSSEAEDGFSSANAGAFHSEVNVPAEEGALSLAIEAVISQMPDRAGADQVFVQPMVQDVIASGVVFTRLMHNGAPYYRVNYDLGQDTTSVTSGVAQDAKSVLLSKNTEILDNGRQEGWMAGLIDAAKELEFLLGIDYLDIEFAINSKHQVFILQSRPLILNEQPSDELDQQVYNKIKNAQGRFDELKTALPKVNGDITGFGVMPDWNPAEIIGTHPSALSTSLYAYLIMDGIWAQQRAEFGYQDVRPAPLMRLFCGQPYVDIRASFASFVPRGLNKEFVDNYINQFLKKLKEHPEFHDKIEFEIIPTCYDFNFSRWTNTLSEDGFKGTDIKALEAALHSITLSAFQSIHEHDQQIDEIEKQYVEIQTQNCANPVDKALSLLEACRLEGTLNFSHMARYGFIAVILLRSAAQIGVVSEERVDEFLLSIETVSTQYQQDAWAVAQGNMSFESFVSEYGHLRPGSYDPLSKRYDEDVEFYLRHAVDSASEPVRHEFVWSEDERHGFEGLLKEHGFDISLERFERFCHVAIAGRERSKFVFSRFLSGAIQLLLEYGESIGITRENTGNIPLSEWENLARGIDYPNDRQAYFKDRCGHYAKEFYLSQHVELPPLLFDIADFTNFTLGQEKPNFITKNRVIAEVVYLDMHECSAVSLEGKIVCIQAADPGYDWLFNHRIAGLITQYGGANSHMAIRAAEFGLPSAIGVGANKLQSIKEANKLHLNCETQQIIVLE